MAALLTAALLACGCSAVSAAAAEVSQALPAAQTASVSTEEAIVTVPVTAGHTDAYDIVPLDTASSAPSSSNSGKSVNWVKIILISLAISAVVTGIAIYMIYRGYKYNGMTEPYEFKHKAPLHLQEREDALIDVHVTSVHIEHNNN